MVQIDTDIQECDHGKPNIFMRNSTHGSDSLNISSFTPHHLTSPHLTSPHLTSLHLTSRHLFLSSVPPTTHTPLLRLFSIIPIIMLLKPYYHLFFYLIPQSSHYFLTYHTLLFYLALTAVCTVKCLLSLVGVTYHHHLSLSPYPFPSCHTSVSTLLSSSYSVTITSSWSLPL